MSTKYSVCFSGYRLRKFSATDDLVVVQQRLAATINACVQKGYHTFLSGMADGFDMMAAEEIVKIKALDAQITFIAAIPCYHWRTLSPHEQGILDAADTVVAVAEKAGTAAYHMRNRYLVDNASLLVCYYSGTPGGTRYTVNYAKSKGLEIINIFDVMNPDLL